MYIFGILSPTWPELKHPVVVWWDGMCGSLSPYSVRSVVLVGKEGKKEGRKKETFGWKEARRWDGRSVDPLPLLLVLGSCCATGAAADELCNANPTEEKFRVILRRMLAERTCPFSPYIWIRIGELLVPFNKSMTM